MFCISPGKFARISISNATKKHTQSIRSDPPPRFPSRVVSQFDQKFLDFRLPKIHVRTFSRCQKRVGPFFRGPLDVIGCTSEPTFFFKSETCCFSCAKIRGGYEFTKTVNLHLVEFGVHQMVHVSRIFNAFCLLTVHFWWPLPPQQNAHFPSFLVSLPGRYQIFV